MALINCPECNKEISDKALNCPNCGVPINEKSETKNYNDDEYLCCPKCFSKDLHTQHKGFSGGKALTGALLTGGIGLLAGTIGSKDLQISCMKCGNKFKAGEAKIVNLSSSNKSVNERVLDLLNQGKQNEAIDLYRIEKGVDRTTAFKEVLATINSLNPEEKKKLQTNYNSNNGGCASVIILLIVTSTIITYLFS